jgi:hypothetical protein
VWVARASRTAASQGCFAFGRGFTPRALRARSERSRAFSRRAAARSSGVIAVIIVTSGREKPCRSLNVETGQVRRTIAGRLRISARGLYRSRLPRPSQAKPGYRVRPRSGSRALNRPGLGAGFRGHFVGSSGHRRQSEGCRAGQQGTAKRFDAKPQPRARIIAHARRRRRGQRGRA